jgi:hypothetical protein
VTWSDGAPPETIAEALGEAAFTVAVLEALLEDRGMRQKALAALRPTANAVDP